MEKKITKKIRKAVSECMRESIDAVEVMRVSEAIGITADAIYAVPGDAVHLAKIIVLGEDEEIDDKRLDRIYYGLWVSVDALPLRRRCLLHNRNRMAPYRWEHRACCDHR